MNNPPTDPPSPSTRKRMQAVARKDTGPEVALRSALHRLGLRFRVNARLLSNARFKADIVFGPSRVVVFVDGCFWHGCPQHLKLTSRNTAYWRVKIERNRARDVATTEALRHEGWEVVRVWEHEDASAAAAIIAGIVAKRRTPPSALSDR